MIAPGVMRAKVWMLSVARALLWALPAITSAAQDPVQTLMREALTTHPSIKGQEYLLQSSKAGVDAAEWQFYPTPSASVEQGRFDASDPSYQGDARVYTLRLQQPIWTGGRLTAGLDKAKANEDASKGSVEDTGQTLVIGVIDACGELGASELRLMAYERSVKVHTALIERVSRRVAAGASPESDLTLAKSRYSATQSDLDAAKAQQEVALEKLRQLVGRQLGRTELCSVRNQFPVMTARPENALVNEALEASPALVKLKAQAESVKQDIELAKSDLSPEVYVRLERQYGNFNLPGYGGTGFNRVFLGVSTRFGAGLSNLSVIDAARAKYDASLTDIETRKRLIAELVRSEYARGVSAQARRKLLLESFKDSELVALSWDRQFLAGRKQWQDVMNAAREHAQTEVALADSIAAGWTANWRLTVLADGVLGALRFDFIDPKKGRK